MQTDHSKAISGLSIATIIISALSIVACIVGLVFMGIGGNMLNQYGPGAIDEALSSPGYESHHYYYDDDYYYYSDDLDTDDIMALGNFGLALGSGLIVWEMIMCAVALVAGIFGLRNAKDRSGLGKVFGWSIAGAICSLLGGSIVVMVLLIITAVFSYKDKNAPAAAYGAPYGTPYGQPGTPGAAAPMQPQPYGQAAAPQAAPTIQPQTIVVQPPANQQPVAQPAPAQTAAPEPAPAPAPETQPLFTPAPTETAPVEGTATPEPEKPQDSQQ